MNGGGLPPQNFLIVLQSRGEISPTLPNLCLSAPLRSAAHGDQAISIQSGDARQLHRKISEMQAWGAVSRAAAVFCLLISGTQRLRARLLLTE